MTSPYGYSDRPQNVCYCYWHFASIQAHALTVRYWSNSGHWSALALNGSVANDP
jgi:hypothetical protein